ncbi:MAG: CapA family protein, partial [Proteobacteria bacterium]|nr:CapA family protein [Pseudomonadota bacterium]
MKRNHSGSCTSLLFQHTLLIIVASLSVRTLSAQELNPDQLATTVSDGFTIAVVGDIIISYSLDHMMGDAGFRAVVELIQGADVSTGNLEGNIIDGRKFRGSAGGGFGGEPEVAEWVKTMGFDIVSRPNN